MIAVTLKRTMSSCYYTHVMDEEFSELDFTEPEEEILISSPDEPLKNLTPDDVIRILDISDYRAPPTSNPLPPLAETPPSSPESLSQNSRESWYYGPSVSSTGSPPDSPLSPREELPWSPDEIPVDPLSHPEPSFTYPPFHQWNDYDEPSPMVPQGHGRPTPTIAFDEMALPLAEEETDFEPWITFDHVRQDGTCECLDKKKVTKCLARKTRRRRTNQLWNFLLEVLSNPKYQRYIRWLSKEAGVFKFEQSQEVARLWGERKHKKKMTYEYMSRAMRHYYIQGIMRRVEDKRLTYQFGPNAENWRQQAYAVPPTYHHDRQSPPYVVAAPAPQYISSCAAPA